MKAVELVPVDAITQQVRIVEVVGFIRHDAGAERPWYGRHGAVGQYFSNQSEAVRFASTGKA